MIYEFAMDSIARSPANCISALRSDAAFFQFDGTLGFLNVSLAYCTSIGSRS